MSDDYLRITVRGRLRRIPFALFYRQMKEQPFKRTTFTLRKNLVRDDGCGRTKCLECNGTKEFEHPDRTKVQCNECKGSGWIWLNWY